MPTINFSDKNVQMICNEIGISPVEALYIVGKVQSNKASKPTKNFLKLLAHVIQHPSNRTIIRLQEILVVIRKEMMESIGVQPPDETQYYQDLGKKAMDTYYDHEDDRFFDEN